MAAEFEISIGGAGMRPETLPAGELGRLLVHLESALLEAAKSAGIDLAGRPAIALLAVERGSAKLRFAVAPRLRPVVARLVRSIGAERYAEMPRETQAELHAVYQQASKHGWDVELQPPKGEPARIATERPVPEPPTPPEPIILRGTTSVVGRCRWVGGVTPRAELELPTKKLLKVSLGEGLAKRLAQQLYEQVVLEGVGHWRADTMELVDFEVLQVAEFRPKPLAEAFGELASAARGQWDGVDADDYVKKQRGGP